MIPSVNLELFATGISIASSLLLGFMIYFRDRKSVTNSFFLFFAFANSCWVIFNYLAYRTSNPTITLWMIRITMFFAVYQALSFFLLMVAFPNKDYVFPSWWKYFLFPLVTVISLITLTPILFSKVNFVGNIPQPVPGAGIILFALTAISLVIGGIVTMLRKIKIAKGIERSQLIFVAIGVISMFLLIVSFNFLLTAVFGNASYAKLSPLFTVPFFILTTYAIIKHQFLNVKIVGTEIFVFFLTFITFLEIILSVNPGEIIFRLIIFISLLIFSILLIKSIIREVKQKEQLEILSKNLEIANSKLVELDKLKDDFVSVASHELRTPMTAIKSYLWMALNHVKEPLAPDLKKYLDIAYFSTDRLIKLVQDMLTISRIEGNRLSFNLEKINLYDCAKQIYDELKIEAEKKKIELTIKSEVEAPLVEGDKDKLKEVIQNLLGNALKFTPNGGKIEIILSQNAENIETRFKDTGPGIKEEDRARLFGKFERIDSVYARNPQITGTGLGLYITKQIVALHKGKIWVNSKVGEGSTFIFSLPKYQNNQ